MAKRKPRPKRPAPAEPDKPARPPRGPLSAPAVCEAIIRYSGNLAAVARSFGVTRSSVWEYVEARPELKLALKDARETRVDNAESSLDRAVLTGEGWAVTLILKTLGKDRGYVEKQELNLTGGGRLEVVEEIVDAPDQPATTPKDGQSPPGSG